MDRIMNSSRVDQGVVHNGDWIVELLLLGVLLEVVELRLCIVLLETS
jgi:hypothetical protein